MPPSCAALSTVGSSAFNRLGDGHGLDRRRAAPPLNLGAEREQVVLLGQDRRPVYRSEPRNRRNGLA